MEAKIRLEQAKKDKGLAIEWADKEIAALEKQIAAEAKPKLRHGDYGFDLNGFAAVSMKKFSVPGLSRVSDACIHSTFCHEGLDKSTTGVPSIVTGNIFDDLKATQETVTEFENRGTIFRLNIPTGEVMIATPRGVGYVDLASIAPLIRQMLATLKRNK